VRKEGGLGWLGGKQWASEVAVADRANDCLEHCAPNPQPHRHGHIRVPLQLRPAESAGEERRRGTDK